MRVSSTARDSVLFIGIRNNAQGTIDCGGTAFVAGVEGVRDKGLTFLYLVTAKRIADKIQAGIGGNATVVIRGNVLEGSSIEFEAGFDRWYFHPDESVDAAVSIFAPSPYLGLDTRYIPMTHFLSDGDIGRHRIGPGDEAFMTALSTGVPGASRNLPLVRRGNVALMPEEKIQHGGVSIDAYLVEARSNGGLTGSPAFVSATVRMRHTEAPSAKEEHVWVSGETFFMGLVSGDWDACPDSGISLVVPAKSIREILDSPEQKKLRKDVEDGEMPDGDDIEFDVTDTPVAS